MGRNNGLCLLPRGSPGAQPGGGGEVPSQGPHALGEAATQPCPLCSSQNACPPCQKSLRPSAFGHLTALLSK